MTLDDQLRELGEAARRFSDETIFFHAALSSRLGLGLADWKAMSLLEAQGPMTAGEIARLTGLTPPSVTAMLRRLQEGGWIVRGADAADARRVVIALDPGALDRLGDGFSGIQRRTAALYAGMNEDERARALALLTALSAATAEARAELLEESQVGRT